MAFLSTLQLANPRGLRARAGLLREHRAGFDALFEVAATAMERLETPRDRVSLYDKKYTVVFGDDHWKS
ncbi:hypothetical protein, partial [Enterobacter hormaechei]|uniref:hypothetical protein n=1 Tax=Enterobacter hormaechei TaxID=158836 RepID=UPI001953EDC1